MSAAFAIALVTRARLAAQVVGGPGVIEVRRRVSVGGIHEDAAPAIPCHSFACVLARSSSAWAQLDIGVDRSLLSAQSAAVEEKAFKDIRAVRAIWFRDGPTRGSSQGIANFVDEVRRAKENHLKVLMPLVQMDEDYDGPLPTNQCGWKEEKMSAINLDKFATRVRRLLDALKGAGLMIDAVQLGNEDDLYCYDADVPNGHAATRAEIATWLRGYGQFLKTGAKIVHEPRYYPEAKTAKAAG